MTHLVVPKTRVGLKSHLSKSNRMKVIGDRSQVKSSQTGWFVLVARVKSLNVCRNNKSSQSQRQSDLKVAKKVMLEIATATMTSGLSPKGWGPHQREDPPPNILCRINEKFYFWFEVRQPNRTSLIVYIYTYQYHKLHQPRMTGVG